MTIVKTEYTVIKDGELIINKLPFKKGEKLDVVIHDDNNIHRERNWRELYLKKILSTSVWSAKDIEEIEKASKEINEWKIPE